MHDDDRDKRLEELFRLGVEVPFKRREEFLERHCADDPELREELRGLLAQDDRGTKGVLGGPAMAMPAVVPLWGPPWRPGNTARSMALACFLSQRIMPPRGPRKVLWVVLVTTPAWPTGEGWTPAATRPEMWAISATKIAPTSSAICAKRGKSSSRG